MSRSFIRLSEQGLGASDVDLLARHIGQLLRHPAYRRENIVSPLLLRHLPRESGYDWRGEGALRQRLVQAALDPASFDHLLRNVQDECLRLRRPAEA